MTSISSTSTGASYIQQSRPSLFQKADTDSSGGVSLEEFTAVAPKDENGNPISGPGGKISSEDIFAKLDGNQDGTLTEGELEAGKQKAKSLKASLLSSDLLSHLMTFTGTESGEGLFSTLDTDSDGSISESELQTAVEDMISSAQEDSTASLSGAPAEEGGGAPPPPPLDESEDSEETSSATDLLDTDGDGTVSLEELMAAMETDSSDETASNQNDGNMRFGQMMKYLLSVQEQMSAVAA